MNANEKLMQILYYSPNTQFTSIRSLYNELKNRGVKYQEVKEFVQKQESNQLFRKQKRIKNYFPIAASYKFEIIQLDLVDFSDIALANENYRYLVVAVDVFSRLAFVIPIKSRRTENILEALEEIITATEPTTINSDHEFTSHAIKNFFAKRGIDLEVVDVGDHHKLGIVDRFCRTLREKLNKYMAMYNTTKYIDVLSKIVYNYNSSYHSGIKTAPNKVEEEDEKLIELTRKKIEKAKQEETIFKIGDVVRYIINKKQFEKGTLPKWSKAVHKIISKNVHSYKLDNSRTYKYYELQKISDVQLNNKPQKEPTREDLRKQNTIKRKLKHEDINLSNIAITERTRKPIDRF